MDDHRRTPTSRNTDRVIVHTPTSDNGLAWRLTASNDYEWVHAKQRAEKQLQSIVYDATRDMNIAADVPKPLRQIVYDLRTRASLARDFARILEVIGIAGRMVSQQQAWEYVDRIHAIECELASAVFGPRVSEGPQPTTHSNRKEHNAGSLAETENLPSGRGALLGSDWDHAA